MKVYVPRCAKTVRKTFFSVRVCNSWNSLPQHVIEAQSTNSFKNRLDKFWSGMKAVEPIITKYMWYKSLNPSQAENEFMQSSADVHQCQCSEADRSCNNVHNHYPFTMDKNSAAQYKILRHIGSAQQAWTGTRRSIKLHMTDCILLIIITTCQ